MKNSHIERIWMKSVRLTYMTEFTVKQGRTMLWETSRIQLNFKAKTANANQKISLAEN